MFLNIVYEFNCLYSLRYSSQLWNHKSCLFCVPATGKLCTDARVCLHHTIVYIILYGIEVKLGESVEASAGFFTAQLAGEARQLGCPKIVLDHVRVLYIMFVRFGFPHYWLYTMLLTTHLPRGLRGLRTSNVSWQTTVN